MALRAPAMPGCRETLPFSDVSDHRDGTEMERLRFHHPSHWHTTQKARCQFGPSTLGRNGLEAEFAIAQETDMQTPRKQGIVRDDRGQTEPADKQRAQQSQMEGPAAYAPHEGEKKANPKRDPAKKKTGHESE
jgi:hypothetical protein